MRSRVGAIVGGLVLSLSAGGAIGATDPSQTLTPGQAEADASVEALYRGLEQDLSALCPGEALEPYLAVIAARTSTLDLELVVSLLSRLQGADALCASARQAAQEANELAQFAVASTEDATGAIGEAALAPFGFGGAPPPGGAGYLN